MEEKNKLLSDLSVLKKKLDENEVHILELIFLLYTLIYIHIIIYIYIYRNQIY